ncbi:MULTISPECIES: cupin domain-containing protein [Halobacteriales]|jgi:quercetin dioxygenase-like cupin family protein|uniref:Cupin n=1 Tax=Natrialba aegyptia DSM 13077 TaxID=1227491 RepID=M0ANH2_9EURY|nr:MULTISPECIES: cupin domain-containing protein [Halobacteria]ELZ00286.1 cupin [Natrialba aegyptia DSM 13077]MCF2206405.1 cupin domain-containing protein [Halobacterium salinarum]MCF2240035.1 cupin domain-containing protein [Halobacterium salinarum]
MAPVKSIEDCEGVPHAAVFPTEEPKTIRLSLDEGESVGAHSHPERQVILYLISGEIDLQLDGESHIVQSGDVVQFDGTREVAPAAQTDSTALIVLAKKSD